MLNYLQVYCDINEIYEVDYILQIGKAIIKDPEKSLKTFSRFGFILKAFQELLQEKRDLESFMVLGDITSDELLERDLLPAGALEQIIIGIESGTEYDNAIIVVDSIVLTTNNQDLFDKVAMQVSSRGSTLFMIQ